MLQASRLNTQTCLPRLLGAALGAVAAIAHAGDLVRYENPRFGFALSYPAEFIAEAAPANGDGRRFTKDGACEIRAFGVENVLDQRLIAVERERARDFTKITRRARGTTSFALSGMRGDRALFVKVFVGKGVINELRIEQPAHSDACTVDTRAVAASFRPGRLN